MVSDMRETWSEQYNLPCVDVEDYRTASADAIIAMCEDIGAIRRDDPDGDEYVVVLRHDVGPELWTESSLRRTCNQPEQQGGG